MSTKNLYDILELDQSANLNDIKKAYYRLALIYHPDKNNDSNAEQKFKDISLAYNILSDPEKRKQYDMYGDYSNNINQLNNMFNTFNFDNSPFKYMNINLIKVTLEELYNGTDKVISVNKNINCDSCNGTGGENAVTKCDLCKGTGIINKLIKTTFGLINQSIKCNCTNGNIINLELCCKKCNGSKIISQEENINIYIKPGMYNNQELIIDNNLFIIKEEKHKLYKRSGNNLIININISLTESLCGFKKLIKTLNNKKIILTNLKGNVIKNNDVKYLSNYGMSIIDSKQKGDLLLIFKINDIQLTYNQIEGIKKYLPVLPEYKTPSNCKIKIIKDYITETKQEDNNIECNQQ